MRNKKPVFFLLVTVFLTAIGMMVVAPVMPFYVKEYVSDSGRLAMVIGWLAAAYSICQFFAAPGLGALSDRYGRRPVLLLCLFGSAVGYALFGIGGALPILFLGRILDGLTGGDLSILMAYVADITEPEERGKLFGQIGATVGIGFLLGPVIGGMMAKFGVRAPLFLTAAIMLLNMLWGYFGLPESLRPENRRAEIRLADLNPFIQLKNVLAIARLRSLLLAGFLYGLVMVFMQVTMVVMIMDHLGWHSDRIGLIYLVVGGIDILVQGGLMGRIGPVFGEQKLAIAGMIGVTISFGLMGSVAFVGSGALLLAGVVTYAISSGLLEPSLNGLVSRAAGDRDQGVVQGGVQSIRSLGSIVGPLLGGWLYAQVGHAAPYVVSMVLMVIAAFVTRSRPTDPGDAEEVMA